MHNGLGFDAIHINRLLGDCITLDSVIDTLVVSRLLNYRIDGGHSLDAWGLRLGFPKIQFNDFARYSEEMHKYCLQDVVITAKLYQQFKRYLEADEWQQAIHLEHRTAIYCQEMHEIGFQFDIDACEALHSDIVKQLTELDTEIKNVFQPKVRMVRQITSTLTKHGTLHRKDFKWLTPGDSGCIDLSPFSADAPFSLIEYEEFNPGSVKQIVERLNDAGWKPTEKTKGHIEALKVFQRAPKGHREKLRARLQEFEKWGWTVSEENLATLPADAPKPARTLTKRLLLDRRRSTLEEWITAFRRTNDGRIHGRFSPIGSWTHRLSHSEPNQANIVRISYDKDKRAVPGFAGGYGLEFRSMWTCRAGNCLIDVDADGIQLRVLAHYMDDPEFIAALINGKSELGTDAHTLNMRALGAVCKDRDTAKTFIYSWVLGAAPPKTAQILSCTLPEAKEARQKFIDRWPKLKEVKEKQVPRDASRGYFVGFDGRKVLCNSEHKMLSGYLQNGEAIIMKKGLNIWYSKATKAGIKPRRDFWLVDFVHDEYVVESKPEVAEELMSYMTGSIKEAGDYYNLKCPHKGNGRIGYNWAEVH